MRLWLSILAVFLICPCEVHSSSDSQRAHGAAIFAESGCLHCHAIGKTGGSAGPNLSGVGERLREAQMRRQIVNGSKVMPPFGNVLDERDLADLLIYLRSCKHKIK